MTTIKDVAKQAGVSVATVSRVLNGNGYVHEDTRSKVEQSIRELNYTPNEVARSLYKRKSKLIGLLLPDIMNPYFPQLARGVEDEMQENDYRLIFGNSDEKKQKEMEYIQTFVQNNVVGVISSTNDPEADMYTGLNIPVVFLDRTSNDRPSVFADGREGGRIAAQEMMLRGSKEITVMQGPADVRPALERFEGAVEVLEERGAAYQVLKTTSFSLTDAEGFAYELFRQYPDTDGVIASNDIVASAVLKEAHRLEKRVPEDVQIIGFDDILLSSLLAPSLSTIHQPAYEMGRAAARLLIELIEGQHIERSSIEFPVEFMERQTTRKVES
ncbi:transcriptional regulator, LacI family protein [Paenibacillus vortex V453]|jgi:LacI family transcriptional regulator|uniref:Catabolite control protein A n=1 Tax=Paenibacillus vortex V453 TaxID=715225 RepID=A0A2R9SWJ5_9BACL|nr:MULTISPECIES: LacI family DNA-binding transcriptional regulator [Paenibacillus]ANA81860.1 LacI family transcriptional regulator [Paenibacillus glucanolyticus]AVV59407.1 LacI family transcriptional regulator [Paenibacillus glucanolyticus]EFU41747.1 transcriptional regulator, LacI family protein [Paenibacillus vortex V453]ETT43280.1 LacI family transcriptional regulator [Paenibacillus sp. FSL R5-808]MPY16062.1 LacI family transcriptional regulator [Paenibacillus glucanolyticus]